MAQRKYNGNSRNNNTESIPKFVRKSNLILD